jgi:hypothetical protein
VRLKLDPASHAIVISRHDIQAVSITQAHGTLQVSGQVSRMGIAWAGWGYGIILMAVVLFVLNRLRAIFRSLKGENPFVSLNASRIRKIGIVLILGELANTWFGAWYAEQVTREISVAGLTLNADWSINSWVIFSGLILITLAEVFRLGADMKGDLETARKIQSPSPSNHRTLIKSPRLPRKMYTWPENGFSCSAVCTISLSPVNPRRMSVTPATIQMRVPAGSPIIAPDSPVRHATLPRPQTL